MPTDTEHELDEDEIADLTRERDDDDPLITKLRRQLKNKSKELRDARPRLQRLDELELHNTLNQAFEKDEISKLTERQRNNLLREVGDDKSPETLRKVAEELYPALIEPRRDRQQEELEGHERVERAGTGASAAAGVKIDAETVADWPMDKQLRFKAEHASAWEQIKRGEAVHGITF